MRARGTRGGWDLSGDASARARGGVEERVGGLDNRNAVITAEEVERRGGGGGGGGGCFL